MPILFRASFGYLLRHPWQLAPALAGICIGVAVIVAVDLAIDSSRRAFLMSMDAVNGEATHQLVGGPDGVDEALYAALRVDEGLRNIAPIVEGYVDVGDVTLQLIGVDPFAEEEFRDYAASDPVSDRQESLRQLLTIPGAVLLSGLTAAELELSPGESFTIAANGRTFEAHLAGLIGNGDDTRLDSLLVTDISSAQEWLDQAGRLTRIDVRLADNGPDAAAKIRSLLPEGVQVLDAAGRTQAVSDMSAAFMTNLTAMSLLALLVGLFLIYNSVSFAVLQRRGLFGVLRALGVTRREVFALILVEALLLGIVSTAVGIAAGIWLGERLLALVSRSINDLYFVINVTEVVVSTASIVKGLLAGIGATLVAAAVPAREAASYPPRLALTRSVLERRAGKLVPVLAAIGVVAAALAYVVLELSDRSLVAGLVALFLLILGLALCIPVAVRAAASVAAPVASFIGGPIARLAISGIAASLSRTAVAVIALAIAVSATIGVSVMIDSFRSSVGDWVNSTLRSDIYVGVDRGTLQPQLVRDLLAVDGIAAHSTSRGIWLETDAGRAHLTVLDMPPKSYAGIRLRNADPAAVWRAFEEQGAVLVSDSYAYRHGVRPGDTVTLPTANGERTFPVASTYRSYSADLDALLMSRHTYDVFWQDSRISTIGIHLAEGADVAETIERLRSVSDGRQALLIRSNREIRELSMQIFDRTFVITDVLYWLALGVALIGILAAMLALQFERAREHAVFRALGVTPRQLGGLVILQTGFIGLLCGVAAMPLGVLMAWVLIEVINRRAFGWLMDSTVSPTVLLAALGLSVSAAVLAGLYPARQAARSSPALAMREE